MRLALEYSTLHCTISGPPDFRLLINDLISITSYCDDIIVLLESKNINNDTL